MVVCIWLLLSLSILAVSVGRLASSQINFSRFYVDRRFSYYLTRAAIREVCVERDNDMTPNYDTLGELRTKRRIDFSDFRGEYYLIDEENRININSANNEVLTRIFDSAYLAQEIIDYRQREHPFLALEELFRLDIEQELFQQVRDFITASSNGYVNINTASQEVLAFLGCSQDSIEKILSFRNDNIFDSKATIATVFNDLGIECEYDNLLITKSSAYTIRTATYIGERQGLPFDVIYNLADKRIESWKITPSTTSQDLP